jgi:hypothetical protein
MLAGGQTGGGAAVRSACPAMRPRPPRCLQALELLKAVGAIEDVEKAKVSVHTHGTCRPAAGSRRSLRGT